MSTATVPGRYVEALFRLASRSGSLERVGADVERLARELAAPALAARLFDARVEKERRRALLAPLVLRLDPLLRNFVNLLFDKRREEVLRDLGAVWARRALVERGATEGVVESARPLSREDLQSLCQALGARLGKQVRLTNEVDPELVAGVRVVVDNRMLDASVQGRLAGLRRHLLEARLDVTTS